MKALAERWGVGDKTITRAIAELQRDGLVVALGRGQRPVVARWWARHPTDNIAIATGPAGLVVVDLDQTRPGDRPPADRPGATGGADVLDQLADQHGQTLTATWTVQTASGGRHRYYRAPKGAGLRNTAGRAGWKIDTRAGGGYVVAAGSTVAGRP